MRILTVHNKYVFRGGEDESRESEDRLLRARGHEVREVVFDNATIQARSLWRVGLETSWSHQSYRRVRSEMAGWRPDILDVHNFFPLASPSVYYPARSFGVPVVQTLHNYRLLCPSASFLRNGAVCEECARRVFAWPGIVNRCYRQSALQTAAVVLMNSVHRAIGTWQRMVSIFVVLSQFEKRKFVEYGFPESKLFVKPNFVLNSGISGPGGAEFLFVGRLSAEKGVRTLLRAMDIAKGAYLGIVGEGPLADEVRSAASANGHIRYHGRLPQNGVLKLMAASRCLIFPSELYETFGRVAAEAYSCGTPVIASRIGAIAEIVDDGGTGYHFAPGDPADLARTMQRVLADPGCLAQMRINARAKFEQNYTAERNYGMMMEAYQRAMSTQASPA